MDLKISVHSLFYRLFTWLLLSGIVGYFFGDVGAFVSFTSVVMLIWHYRHLHQLMTWLWQSKAISPPQSDGIWGHIFNGLYRQIKRHRQKLKVLNDKIRQFRDGAEALPDAALVLSNDFTILWGNKKAQKLLGIQWPGDVGQRIDNLLRFPEFSKYLESRDFSSPCYIDSPISIELHLELRLMAYGSDQVLFLARDVSKVHRLEEMRKEFVADVSHELKTPLTVIRGYVEMIQVTEHALDPHWNRAFTTIEAQVTRMDRLVEQLLALSRAEINDANNNKQLVDIPALLSSLKDESKWLNTEKQHVITFDVDTEFGIFGIESELKSACANLLSNAIAYTPYHGKIQVVWQKIGDKIKYSVKDNGPGIKPEHINRLTERFYRVDKSRSRDTGGSGLGLAIVKHVLNHHHAKLVINSNVGQGSEFIIYFEAKSIVHLPSKSIDNTKYNLNNMPL